MNKSFNKLIIMDRGKYFVKRMTSVPLNTHIFIPPLYFCSIHYCASYLKCPSHGQCLLKTQLFGSWLTENQTESTCTYSSLCDGLYICICCLYQGVLDLSAINPVLSHSVSRRNHKDGENFQDSVALTNVTLTESAVNILKCSLVSERITSITLLYCSEAKMLC